MAVPPALVGAWVRDGAAVDDEPEIEPADVVWLQGREWFADMRTPRPGVRGGTATMDLGGRTEAFAGRTHWSPVAGVDPDVRAELRWDHHLDRTGGFAGVDAGTIRWLDESSFLETGSVPAAAAGGPASTYVERWRAEPGPAGVLVAVARRRSANAPADEGVETPVAGIIVVVGVHRLVLLDERPTGGPFSFAHDRGDEHGGWHTVRVETGPGTSSAALDAALETADALCATAGSLSSGDVVAGSPSSSWVVVEAGEGVGHTTGGADRTPVHDGVPLSKPYRNMRSVRSAP